MAHNKTKIKIEIIILELILIGAALAIFFISDVEKYEFKEDGTYFDFNYQGFIPSGTRARVSEDTGKTYVKISEDETFNANEIPVYFKASSSFVTMDDYIYFDVQNNKEIEYKISYFTEFAAESGGVKASREDRVVPFTGGFLFSGKDVYIPLETVTVDYNGESLTVSPLSYIYVCKNNWIIIYDIDKDLFIFEYLDGVNPVRMKDKLNAFVVYMESDLMNLVDKKVMLFSNPDLYELYDFGGE